MATYWAILEKVPGSKLRLTKMDDDIFEHLKRDFPEFDPAEPINEDEMKSKTGKERWRTFMMAYDKKIDDYNFGTLLRASPKTEYGEKETIFVPRMQFYAVEIARYEPPSESYRQKKKILTKSQKPRRPQRLDLRGGGKGEAKGQGQHPGQQQQQRIGYQPSSEYKVNFSAIHPVEFLKHVLVGVHVMPLHRFGNREREREVSILSKNCKCRSLPSHHDFDPKVLIVPGPPT